MREEICTAIQERKLLSIYYDWEYRRVEPHVYGQSVKGTELLRAYQVEGYSESGDVVFWKLFDVSKLSVITVLSEQFPGPRPDYYSEDPAIKKIFCQL